ncbi:hypothetical protein [Caldisericum exile]|uniref:hypothetical protein n=1 Tax=Caldisericum exile TaxID=693075 RepID=UPI003C74C90E
MKNAPTKKPDTIANTKINPLKSNTNFHPRTVIANGIQATFITQAPMVVAITPAEAPLPCSSLKNE